MTMGTVTLGLIDGNVEVREVLEFVTVWYKVRVVR